MNVEIIYTGLCAFLNLRGTNSTMGDPSVILVRADDDANHHAHTHPHNGDAEEMHQPHIPFIAYDSSKVRAEASDGIEFKAVDHDDARDFRYLELRGVELSILEDPRTGPLDVRRSYDNLVVKKDDYWPAAKDRWNRAYVPDPGEKPRDTAVSAYMRLYTGTIHAGEKTNQEWSFPVDGEAAERHERRFAFDVVYADVPNAHGGVTIVVTCLDCGHLIRTLSFTPRRGHEAHWQIFIGNNAADDLANALNRRQGENPARGRHFAFLNRIADATLGLGVGPLPDPIEEGIVPSEEGKEEPGGGSDGYCGPLNGNS
ncbi:MAG: hypothetical protein ACXW5U_13405 [Thermoanaerobaculia bacterium]